MIGKGQSVGGFCQKENNDRAGKGDRDTAAGDASKGGGEREMVLLNVR